MNKYTIELMDDSLLNIGQLVKFLNQSQGTDIWLTINQESHCLRSMGVYDLLDQYEFNSVTIDTCNGVESHEKYKINNNLWTSWLKRTHRFDHKFDYSWNHSKIFGCFYGRPTASRLGITSYLHSNYKPQSLIKLKFNVESEDTRKLFELQKLYSWDNKCLSSVGDMLENIRLYSSEYSAYDYTTFEYDYSNGLNYLYKDIFVDLVVEANLEGNSFYPTEKLARAILCRKPFIVMAPRYYLEYLHQMGFKTFGDFWDEGYDNLSSKDRYFAILKLIQHIADQSITDLSIMNNKMSDIVEYNRQLLITNRYHTNIKLYQ